MQRWGEEEWVCEHPVVNDFYRAMAVPVLRSNAGCVRPLWDLGSSTIETPHERRSAICKQEVRFSLLRIEGAEYEGRGQLGRLPTAPVSLTTR